MKLFVTVATYALGKQLGIQKAAEVFARQCNGSDEPKLPAARFIRRLVDTGHEVGLYHLASTSLPQLRSRAAWQASKSGCDAWVMVDDDVECTMETIGLLLTGMGNGSNIVALPCRLRGTAAEQLRVNVVFSGSMSRMLQNGYEYRPCLRAGTGLMVVPMKALQLMVAHYSEPERMLLFRDELDGATKPALFECIREPMEGSGAWLGEDYSFCKRARALGIEVLAPIAGHSNHDGQALDLRELAKVPGVFGVRPIE